MVGAVGIENNNDWNFRDLEEMRENTKLLKKNTGGLDGILNWPLKGPSFFLCHRDSFVVDFSPTALDTKSASGPNSAARMASRLANVAAELSRCLRQRRTQDVLIRAATRSTLQVCRQSRLRVRCGRRPALLWTLLQSCACRGRLMGRTG